MRSVLVEFHRFGDPGTGILRKHDRYLIAAGDCRVREFDLQFDHDELLDLLDGVRPGRNGKPADPTALAKLGDGVNQIVQPGSISELGQQAELIQVDLVVNAAEIGLLPFEALTGSDGRPLLIANPIELTRRVRGQFAEQSLRWPAEPRILFAWAAPVPTKVPHQEHLSALRDALNPWVPAGGPDGGGDTSAVLTILEEATLESISEACRQALDQGKPFSHVHLLAHGAQFGKNRKQRFGLALHTSDPFEPDIVEPERLCEALAPLRGQPVIVTLAACDSANDTNTILPQRSIAHQLHESGIPVVIASQLPLSFVGSEILVRQFYSEILSARDVRYALHQARMALYNDAARTVNDWASIVAYVRLPEGYAEHLIEVGLESVLASLKVIQGWSDRLVAAGAGDSEEVSRIESLLKGRIEELETCLPQSEKVKREGVVEETLGLLGSAEKRLAELRFEFGRKSGAPGWETAVRDGLDRSRSWYRKAFERNLSHHWTGTQFLSLEAVLSGDIKHPGHWHAAVLASRIAARDSDEIWPYVSLAELYLLASAAGQGDRIEEALAFIQDLKGRVPPGEEGRFLLESTERQLRRYAVWWTSANGYFPGGADLSAPAQRLADLIAS